MVSLSPILSLISICAYQIQFSKLNNVKLLKIICRVVLLNKEFCWSLPVKWMPTHVILFKNDVPRLRWNQSTLELSSYYKQRNLIIKVYLLTCKELIGLHDLLREKRSKLWLTVFLVKKNLHFSVNSSVKKNFLSISVHSR